MKIGFIGTGKITTAVAQGLATCESPPDVITVSPRNKKRAERLDAQFDVVQIASSNQDVVNQSDLVFLALSPETAHDALHSLRFTKAHSIISLIPTCPASLFQKWIAPAAEISRAVPLPSIAKQKGPILYKSGISTVSKRC